MKNNTTKGLLTASLIFAGILAIGIIFSGSSGLEFKQSTQETINFLSEADDYEVLPEDVAYFTEFDEPGYVYVDLRNPYEFVKGNIPTSINIPQTELLNKDVLSFFDEAQADSVKVVLISKNEATAIGPWLILKQLGYNNLKVMKGGWDYYATESLDPYDMPEIPKYMVEEPAYDFAAIMELMQSSPAAAAGSDTPEVVIPQRKKKKSVVEGGC